MMDQVTFERLLYRALFLSVVAAILFIGILPINLGAERIPGPDLILLTAVAWVLRRPDYVPFGVVAVALLAEDLLFVRPVGLASGLGLIAVEFLRAREPIWRDLPFLFEWAMVTTVMLLLVVGKAALLAIFLVDQPQFTATLVQLSISILSYPPIVLVSRYVLRVAKPAPGEVDALGHRL